MSKQHQTLAGEPEEAPATPERPEIQPPHDPEETPVPKEVPGREPQELPPNLTPQPETEPGKSDDSVAAELKNRE